MPLIKRFEDIQAWQEARKLVQEIYHLTRAGSFSKDYGLLTRSNAQLFR